MARLFVNVILFVTFVWKNREHTVNAVPQLDLPLDNTTQIRKLTFENQKRFQTNGHADKVGDSVQSSDQSNEIGLGDTYSYDRDRSHRYGPPYSEENDRRFYNNENYNARYNNRNNERQNGDFDDDDKYYAQPRPKPDFYYVSEKDRNNRYGYRDYDSTVRQCFFFE